MTWNQIESKWAAMARRVRADWRGASNDEAVEPAVQESIVTDTRFGLGVLAEKLQETNTASSE